MASLQWSSPIELGEHSGIWLKNENEYIVASPTQLYVIDVSTGTIKDTKCDHRILVHNPRDQMAVIMELSSSAISIWDLVLDQCISNLPQNSSMKTSVMLGTFREDHRTRTGFLSLLSD